MPLLFRRQHSYSIDRAKTRKSAEMAFYLGLEVPVGGVGPWEVRKFVFSVRSFVLSSVGWRLGGAIARGRENRTGVQRLKKSRRSETVGSGGQGGGGAEKRTVVTRGRSPRVQEAFSFNTLYSLRASFHLGLVAFRD